MTYTSIINKVNRTPSAEQSSRQAKELDNRAGVPNYSYHEQEAPIMERIIYHGKKILIICRQRSYIDLLKSAERGGGQVRDDGGSFEQSNLGAFVEATNARSCRRSSRNTSDDSYL